MAKAAGSPKEPTKPKARRPTAAEALKAIELVGEGSSLKAACEELGLHVPSTHTLVTSTPKLNKLYVEAKERRADLDGDTVKDIADKVLKGEYKPDAARVAVDAYKWHAGRMKPKTWGDRQTVEHTDPNGNSPFAGLLELVAANGRPRPAG